MALLDNRLRVVISFRHHHGNNTTNPCLEMLYHKVHLTNSVRVDALIFGSPRRVRVLEIV